VLEVRVGSRRGPRVATLAAVFACAFGCGCTIRDAAPEAPLARGVTFDISADPRTLDPLFAHVDSGAVEPELARLAFEPFFDLDERGRPVPALLREMPTRANGGISPDGRTLRYHLRPGIRWSDGVPSRRATSSSRCARSSIPRIPSLRAKATTGSYGPRPRTPAPSSSISARRGHRPS